MFVLTHELLQESGLGPAELIVSDDGQFAYCRDKSGGLRVIRLSDITQVHMFHLNPMDTFVVSPDHVWFVHITPSTVDVYRLFVHFKFIRRSYKCMFSSDSKHLLLSRENQTRVLTLPDFKVVWKLNIAQSQILMHADEIIYRYKYWVYKLVLGQESSTRISSLCKLIFVTPKGHRVLVFPKYIVVDEKRMYVKEGYKPVMVGEVYHCDGKMLDVHTQKVKEYGDLQKKVVQHDWGGARTGLAQCIDDVTIVMYTSRLLFFRTYHTFTASIESRLSVSTQLKIRTFRECLGEYKLPAETVSLIVSMVQLAWFS